MRRKKRKLFSPIYLTLVLIVLYLPILMVVIYSFNAGRTIGVGRASPPAGTRACSATR